METPCWGRVPIGEEVSSTRIWFWCRWWLDERWAVLWAGARGLALKLWRNLCSPKSKGWWGKFDLSCLWEYLSAAGSTMLLLLWYFSDSSAFDRDGLNLWEDGLFTVMGWGGRGAVVDICFRESSGAWYRSAALWTLSWYVHCSCWSWITRPMISLFFYSLSWSENDPWLCWGPLLPL